jgi:hypothetical protein
MNTAEKKALRVYNDNTCRHVDNAPATVWVQWTLQQQGTLYLVEYSSRDSRMCL